MVKQMLQYARGHVRIRVTGRSYERFLNMCASHRIILWDLKACDAGYEASLSIKSFKNLKPLARKSGTKIRILEKRGLPFFLYANRKRKLLPAGVLFGIFLMLFLSCFIWDIRIQGNEARTDDVVFDFLKSRQVSHGILKSSLDCKALAADIRKAFDNFIWVSVKIQGTSLVIDVKENTDLTLDEKTAAAPSDLVSDVEGTVKGMITRSGTPLVKVGDKVKKGQPLVVGQVPILDDAGEVADYQYCAADADIEIETRLPYQESFSMKYIKKEYTGRLKKGVFFSVLGRHISFLGTPGGFGHYDVVRAEKQLHLTENFYLPLSWGSIRSREYVLTEKVYTKEEAIRKAQEFLHKFLWKIQEKGVQILQNNVKIETGSKSCTAKGEIVLIERAGKRVMRSLGE